MTDDTETIEIDREQLANFLHQRYLWVQEFFPAEEFAESHAGEEEELGNYDHELGYANGNISGETTALHDFETIFDMEPRKLAEEYAEKHDYDTFEKPPFSEETGEDHATD